MQKHFIIKLSFNLNESPRHLTFAVPRRTITFRVNFMNHPHLTLKFRISLKITYLTLRFPRIILPTRHPTSHLTLTLCLV
jgi:hypothetical protein